MFKQIWLLAELNEEMRFVVESPETIQERLDSNAEEKQRKKDLVLFQKKLQAKRKKNQKQTKKIKVEEENWATESFDLTRDAKGGKEIQERDLKNSAPNKQIG